MSWSDEVARPPMSVAVRTDLVLWLQKRLQIEDQKQLGKLVEISHQSILDDWVPTITDA